MRGLRVAVALLAAMAVSLLTSAAPAQAGGWATTVLDPLPDRIESGRAYTVGFWVLQHGSHPYEGDLGLVALRLVGSDGKAVTYRGVALPEPAHFAAAIAIPADGVWRLVGVQGVFADYEIGTLRVPGGLTANPTPTPVAVDDHAHGWGPIRPPVDAAAAVAQPEPTRMPMATSSRTVVATPRLGAVTALAVAVAILATAVLVNRRRRTESRPSD
jgi:hypothetical protein